MVTIISGFASSTCSSEISDQPAALAKMFSRPSREKILDRALEPIKNEYDYMKENLKLRKQLEETEKENRFLKKAAAFFAKESD